MAIYTFTMHLTLTAKLRGKNRFDVVEKWQETRLEDMFIYRDDGIIDNLTFEEGIPNDLVREDGREFLDREDTDENDRPVGGMEDFAKMVCDRLTRDGELSHDELLVSTGLSRYKLKKVLRKLVAGGAVTRTAGAKGRPGGKATSSYKSVCPTGRGKEQENPGGVRQPVRPSARRTNPDGGHQAYPVPGRTDERRSGGPTGTGSGDNHDD